MPRTTVDCCLRCERPTAECVCLTPPGPDERTRLILTTLDE